MEQGTGMGKGILAAWLLLVAAPAAAQTIHKCTGPEGTVFQSAPCAAGQRQTNSYGGQPYAITPQRQQQIQREQRQARTRVQRNAALRERGAVGRSGARGGNCEHVKAQRDQAMRQLGNRRTYEQISFWATEVSRACNHRR